MKQLLAALVFCFVVAKAIGQKGIDNMIEAERNFAAYALKNTVKQAFLQFADSSAIEVENGKLVNGLQLWTNRQDESIVLKWQPQYAEIAASNDLGYTTGPWTFQRSLQDSITSRGQFTTVWHLNKEGKWKFLVDMGVNYKMINNAETVQKVKANAVANATLQSMLSAEDAFTKAASSNPGNAYRSFLSAQSIIDRTGFLPAVSGADQKNVIKELPTGIIYSQLGEGIAASGDFAYVYGSIKWNNKNSAYLHIWRHEKGGWKLALEVLQL